MDEVDDPLHVQHWEVERDASGAIQLAVAHVTGMINLAEATAVVRIRGHELRLRSTDPEALSAWRADLARLLPPVTKLTWLRQERHFDSTRPLDMSRQ